jgi:aldehyde dehydrogenase (NAD+)
MTLDEILEALDVDLRSSIGQGLVVKSPIDGAVLAQLGAHSLDDVAQIVETGRQAFYSWRNVPAPVRGEFVRRLGLELRRFKEPLAHLVTLEAGKILSESRGEVQEMIDMADFAVGLSRQLYGLTMPSERPGHVIREVWQPLGPVGVITAFNFPVAVWAWNAMLAFICGDTVLWKPSEKTPLSALVVAAMVGRVAIEFNREQGDVVPLGLLGVVLGGRDVGGALANHPDVPLISATGSTAMGRHVAGVVAARLGRSLLELGGNNAMILTPSADRAVALRAIVFAAVGTAGQRCTTLRRLIVHEGIAQEVAGQLIDAYQSLPIGDPREDGVLVGPLIDANAFVAMQAAIKHAQDQGGQLLYGGTRVTAEVPTGGIYVTPALIYMPDQTDIVRRETFAPILYIMTYKNFADAIAIQNDVPQGLSSAIFSNHMREVELFCSAQGSDCGLANVNMGTSGAEIGGAFGGEKDTGGGRESGSDVWKNYMRRQTQVVNFSGALPLAQGVRFGG